MFLCLSKVKPTNRERPGDRIELPEMLFGEPGNRRLSEYQLVDSFPAKILVTNVI